MITDDAPYGYMPGWISLRDRFVIKQHTAKRASSYFSTVLFGGIAIAFSVLLIREEHPDRIDYILAIGLVMATIIIFLIARSARRDAVKYTSKIVKIDRMLAAQTRHEQVLLIREMVRDNWEER